MTAAVMTGPSMGIVGSQSPDDWLQIPLPHLRDDLKLMPGPSEADGSPTWTVYDPVRHRYFRFGHAGFAFLSHWKAGTGAALLKALTDNTTVEATSDDLMQFIRFLRGNTLVRCDEPIAVKTLVERDKTSRQSWAKWLLHNYLFMRIPLFRPDRFLTATLPVAKMLLNRRFVTIILALGGLGLILAARQWDQFVHTFQHFANAEGAAAFAVTLTLVKIFHELGHAYTAKRYGCRVPTMGVALMVLWPVLYTDVTDAWRLVSRRQRLLIGAAGVLTELGLALTATFLWSFLPDGPIRSAAFLVATTTWITTLIINASPFMRFDGYYLLSDWLAVSNLQPRAFALSRWWLRRLLFGFDDPPPELLPPSRQRILLVYAFATWLYRLVLFLTIGLLVYHFFFKLLGIALLAVELGWFIGLPILREGAEWVRRRHQFRLNRQLFTTLIGTGLVLWLVAAPWQTQVSIPAVLRAASYATLFPPVPARIETMNAAPDSTVTAGEVLYRLESPDVTSHLKEAKEQQRVLELQIERQAAGGEDLANLGILHEQLLTNLSSQAGLQAQLNRLVLRAPLPGRLTDLPAELRQGLWVKADQPLGTVIGPGTAELRGYVAASDLKRVTVGAHGRFLPDDPARSPIKVEVVDVASVNASVLDLPLLASTQGGPIAVQTTGQGTLVPTSPVYRVTLRPIGYQPAPDQVLPGTVQAEGDAQSLLARAGRSAAAVVIRESGF